MEDRFRSLLINGPPGAQLKELPTIHCHARSKSKDAFPQRPRFQKGPWFAWRGLVFSRMAAPPQRATVPGSKAVRSYHLASEQHENLDHPHNPNKFQPYVQSTSQ